MLGHAVLHLQMEGQEQHIDISSLPIGVYVVAATTAGGEMHRQKLVVQR
jgi:hypothetical protein